MLGTSLVACAPAVTSPIASLPLKAGQLWQYTVTPEGQPPITGIISAGTVQFTTPIDAPKNDSTALMAGEISRGATLLYFPKSGTIKLSLYSELNQETGNCTFVFTDKHQRVVVSDYSPASKTSRVIGKCELRLIS